MSYVLWKVQDFRADILWVLSCFLWRQSVPVVWCGSSWWMNLSLSWVSSTSRDLPPFTIPYHLTFLGSLLHKTVLLFCFSCVACVQCTEMFQHVCFDGLWEWSNSQAWCHSGFRQCFVLESPGAMFYFSPYLVL